MVYRTLGGLTATSLGLVLQVPQLGYAQKIGVKSFEPQLDLPDHTYQFAQFATRDRSDASVSNESGAIAEPQNLDNWLPPSAGLISVYPHSHDLYQAITVYIRSIPVITFIGAEQPGSAGAKTLARNTATVTDPDLVARVLAVVTQLEAFSQADRDASHIGVRWEAAQEAAVISLAERDLVTINETTIFPNTFQSPAVDALQVVNRLRYLLGDAPPLAKIEGLPDPEPAPVDPTPRIAMILTGVASWYGPGFHGRRTASGEIFNQQAMTAAHRHLPFGTQVRVTNLNNGRQVVVRINDRGPFSRNRTIDLSAGAATTLGMTYSGLARVKLEVFDD
jgi:rare lipoprotein A